MLSSSDGVGGVPSVPLLPLLSRDPQQLGDFRLLGRLGAGGMGTAFLGQGPSGWVVVKEAHASIGADPAIRARMQREVAAMRKAAGPHTAAVVDADLDGEVPWVAMEFIPGETLARTVSATGPLPAEEISTLARGLLAALEQLHERGVVHRDLKPSNVMLSPSGPRLIDLGIADVDESTQLTRTGSVMGSTGWLAPEQIRGEDAGPATDIHAWALCLIYAATGEPPFGSDTSAAAMYRVLETTPEVPTSIPEPLRGLLAQALNKDPTMRPGRLSLERAVGGAEGMGFAPRRAPTARTASTSVLPPSKSAESAESADLVVHVLGGVERPGVFRLPAGARVADAIDAAGGVLLQSALASLDVDRPLVDGERVTIGGFVVGDVGPCGGIIFYDAGSTQSWGRYLEVAPEGWCGRRDSSMSWCVKEMVAEAVPTRFEIGTGAGNTRAIVAHCGRGASLTASEYRGGGLSDWFLPSREELNALYQQRALVAGLRSGFYWTSSQADDQDAFAWGQHFKDGRQAVGGKILQGYVRPIRIVHG